MTQQTPAPSIHANSDVQNSWLVAQREITTRLRSKAFIISTAILLVAALAGVLIAGFTSNSGEEPEPTGIAVEVAAADQLGAVADSGMFDVTEVADRAEAEELLHAEEVDAAVLEGGGGDVNLTVLALEGAPVELTQTLSASPTVELLDDSGGFDFMAYIIAIAFGIIFMSSAITFGSTIAQSVVEEKQTRIVEILLASVSSRALLAGKIIGNSLLALGTVVAIIVVASVGMLATGQDLLLGELGTSLIWFGILFAFGFVLLATLYASTAALVSRQEDVGSVTSPVMILVMIPYVMIIMFFDNPEVLNVMSYVPFSAPVGMPMRLYLGEALWWEPILSLAILLVTIALFTWIGSRIYRNSVLRTGTRVSLTDAIAGRLEHHGAIEVVFEGIGEQRRIDVDHHGNVVARSIADTFGAVNRRIRHGVRERR